jgi:hypothetical protein
MAVRLSVLRANLSLQQAVDVHRAEMSRLQHFLDNRLTDGGEAVLRANVSL